MDSGAWPQRRKVGTRSLWTPSRLRLACGSYNLRRLKIDSRMSSSKSSSQNSALLQLPGKVPSSSRTLRPPSPARTQAGFVVPPQDSRTTISVARLPGQESPGPLGRRGASPRPPALANKFSKTNGPSAPKPKAKPGAKGKARSSTSKRARSPSPSGSSPGKSP
ncbi:hypothetical protein DFH28DRAFT_932465 [Melampsora americana]|nr:hypothetical protein DFH28DRAFT_932465 [Melampsora americana]